MGKASRRARREARNNAPAPAAKSRRVPLAAWFVAAVVVVGAGAWLLWPRHGGPPPSEFVNPLLMLSDELNATCPRMISADTRLDSTGAGPGARFLYYFTILNVNTDRFAPGEFEKMMRSVIVGQLQADPQNAIMRELRVALEYHYLDNTGRPLGTVRLGPGEY